MLVSRDLTSDVQALVHAVRRAGAQNSLFVRLSRRVNSPVFASFLCKKCQKNFKKVKVIN
jgi:transposase-like protein